MEELEYVDAERRGAGDADTQPAAGPLPHRREHEPVGDALLQAQTRRDTPAGAAETARMRTDPERPAAERALEPALALDLAEDAGVDLLVDARHGRQDRRVHGLERLGDARRLGDESDRRAVVGGGLVGEPAEGVRERQEKQ